MLSVLGVYAQRLAARPETQKQSTSGMVYSGSTLPQAAATGTYVTGTTVGSYSPTKPRPGHIRKDGDPFAGQGTAGDVNNPNEPATPLGDVLWPLMLVACMYALMRVILNRKRVRER